jgi:hypothetical protein
LARCSGCTRNVAVPVAPSGIGFMCTDPGFEELGSRGPDADITHTYYD